MKKVRLTPDIDPIGTKHYLTAGGINYPYHVISVWGADTFAPSVEPLIVAECRAKGIELANPFLTLPLSVFAEVFQYSDSPFWLLVKQTDRMNYPLNAELEKRIETTNDAPTTVRTYADYPTEGHAESVPE